MELKIKESHWSSGIPVATINLKVAEELGVHAGDRILIKTKKMEMAVIVDTVSHGVNKGEIKVSNEAKKLMNLRTSQKIKVAFSTTPRSVFHIKKKLSGKRLTHKEINEIIRDVVNNTLSEPEVAMFVSGMYKNGMVLDEKVGLIKAILKNGDTIKFKRKYVVDKHCIGGIAGNRTTPIVISICASAGLTMPKTSSRAITSAAGTADTMETLTNVDFPLEKIEKVVKKVGACLTWGGAVGMVPADSKIIKVEKMLKIDPEAQLLASIMAKKLAVGSKYILIDIPYGKNAKVSKKMAKHLKLKFLELAKHFKVEMKVVLTYANEPIGLGIGPELEMIDVLNVLNPIKKGPKDLREKSIYLAGEIFDLTGICSKGEGEKKARELLDSGKAYEKFKEIVKAQGGKVREVGFSTINKEIKAKKNGKIKEIDNHSINNLARVAGAPVDKSSGVYFEKKTGEKVREGETILTIYAESRARLNEAIKFYELHNPVKIK